jgi:hypothetical protein
VDETRTTTYGTWPKGWCAVCDATLCSPLERSTETTSYGMLHSFAMSATRRVQVDRGNACSLKEVLMIKVQIAQSAAIALLFEVFPSGLIYVLD